jgi:hypothetical protein
MLLYNKLTVWCMFFCSWYSAAQEVPGIFVKPENLSPQNPKSGTYLYAVELNLRLTVYPYSWLPWRLDFDHRIIRVCFFVDKVALGKICLFVLPFFSLITWQRRLSNALIKDMLHCYAAVRNRRNQQDNLHPDIPTRVLRVDFSLLQPIHTPACWGKGANYWFLCYCDYPHFYYFILFMSK